MAGPRREIRTRDDARREQRAAARVNYELRQALRDVLATRSGQLVIQRVLERTGVDKPTARGNTIEAWLSVGHRDVGLAITELLDQLEDGGALRDAMRKTYELMEARALQDATREPAGDDAEGDIESNP